MGFCPSILPDTKGQTSRLTHQTHAHGSPVGRTHRHDKNTTLRTNRYLTTQHLPAPSTPNTREVLAEENDDGAEAAAESGEGLDEGATEANPAASSKIEPTKDSDPEL